MGGKSYSSEASFSVKPFELHKLDKGPETEVSVTKEEAVMYYKYVFGMMLISLLGLRLLHFAYLCRQMQTIRRMELKADQLYKQKIIRGFCHLYDGQVYSQ